MADSGPVPSVRVIGGGRAGTSIAHALGSVGWAVHPILGRRDDVTGAGRDTDLVVIATPDAEIGAVAARIAPGDALVVHLSGALGLDVLAGHPRVGAVHPLAALPDSATGTRRLLDGCTFAVAGDRLVERVVSDLGGRPVRLPDELRPLYHAAAVVAANHLVALAGQVERLAALVDVPIDAYWDLMSGALDNVRRLGARAALTGPAARRDTATIERHLAALPDDERAGYQVLSDMARRLIEEPQ